MKRASLSDLQYLDDLDVPNPNAGSSGDGPPKIKAAPAYTAVPKEKAHMAAFPKEAVPNELHNKVGPWWVWQKNQHWQKKEKDNESWGDKGWYANKQWKKGQWGAKPQDDPKAAAPDPVVVAKPPGMPGFSQAPNAKASPKAPQAKAEAKAHEAKAEAKAPEAKAETNVPWSGWVLPSRVPRVPRPMDLGPKYGWVSDDDMDAEESTDPQGIWTCSICTAQIQHKCVITDCMHCFHRSCCFSWWAETSKEVCPTCRRVVESWDVLMVRTAASPNAGAAQIAGAAVEAAVPAAAQAVVQDAAVPAAAKAAMPAAADAAEPASAKAAMPLAEGAAEQPEAAFARVRVQQGVPREQNQSVEDVAGGPLPVPEGADAALVLGQVAEPPDVADRAAPKAADGVLNVPVAVHHDAVTKAAKASPQAVDVAPVHANSVPKAAEVDPKAKAAVAAPKAGQGHPQVAAKRRSKKSPEIPSSWKL